MSDYENGQICVASCFAFSDSRCIRFFIELGEALAERMVQLVVLGTQDVPELGFPQLQVPYSLLGFDDFVRIPDLVPIHAVTPLANAEYAWTGETASGDTWARAIAKCEWFYRVIAEELSPCAALLWNTSHPNSRVGRNILQANDVPAWCLERGQLAGTYQIQAGEVNAWDDSLAVFSTHAGFEFDLDRQPHTTFDAARAYSDSVAIDRHVVDATSADLPEFGGKGPVVLVLTSALGSSIEPRDVRSINLSQPFWERLQSIIGALDASLPQDATILFRDHPINRNVIGAPLRLPQRFIEMPGTPIAELIDRADRVACIGTTTLQYEALLRDKPLLVLGRSLATRSGAAYAPSSRHALDAAVSDWIADSDGLARRRNARGLIGLLCERHLIREDGALPHIRHGVSDLADFIAAQSLSGTAPVADRIARFTQRFIDGSSLGGLAT